MHPIIVFVSCTGCPPDFMADQRIAHKASWIRTAPGASAMDTIGQHQPDLVVVHSGTESESGVLSTIGQIKSRFSSTPVFLVAPKSSESLAIGALKAGVDDYFKYPLCEKDLLASIQQQLCTHDGCKSIAVSEGQFSDKLVGKSRTMEELKDLLDRVSIVDSTVLITGETGTGKELAASIIHENSARGRKPMISVNCAALPDSLVESELFGYQRGAFTGAVDTTRGRFELAQGGTVFLDEIGDMTPFAQAKILKVIEDREVSPLGGAHPVALDFRLIAATNRQPESIIEEGAFRDDLFYRLNVARIHMPSIREHREDIPLLVDHCIRKLNRKFNRDVQGLSKDAIDLLYRYDWPGNVRELINVLEGAYVNMPLGNIDFADLPAYFKNKLIKHQHAPVNERKQIISALLETNWNKTTAAKKLNWSRMTLYRKISRYQIVEKRSHRQV
ncbi:ZraR2: two component system response regulator, sigma54-specific [Desulfosarcina variabilis str. Montpellier]|uniref:sigma-54 dependent transcriptional regulator n=1 Tax=Desulfosarcina variabilis TaxID=2300 RepID=UPI003AFA6FF8